MSNGIAMRVIIPAQVQQQTLNQLHSNHMGIEKQDYWGEFIYWVSMNANIENAVRNWSACLKFQQVQLKDKINPHEIPGKLIQY